MKTLSKVLLTLVAAVPFAAAAKKPVALVDLTQVAPRTLVATSEQTPKMVFPADVWALTPDSVLGFLQFVDAEDRADQVRAEFGVRDPAQYIASSLGRDVGAALGMASADAPGGPGSGVASGHSALRSAGDLATAYGTHALVIDVGTIDWFVDEVGEDRYRVSYLAKAQVVDTDSRTVLASRECMAPLKEADVAPPLAAMLVNDAESLKVEIRAAADHCLDVFRRGLFSDIAER